jgi:uroporphyrinogen-III synthase
MAGTIGRGETFRAGLARATVVCRGPKPVAVLKREGLPVHVRAGPPHTTNELLNVLAPLAVEGHDVVVVHDGGANRTVAESLASRGARVVEVHPYEWALPEDLSALRELVVALVAGRLDALAITTQVQARHLFIVAEAMQMAHALREVLRDRIIVAAVGPTCAQVLAELGAPPHVMPDQAKMGPMVMALAERIAQRM